MAPYFTYLLRCSDGTFYAGMCRDLEQRLHEHNHTDKGAKYTRSRRPVSLHYQESCPDRSTALRREHALKQLSHDQKELLGNQTF